MTLIEVYDHCSPSDWTYFEAVLKKRLGNKFLIYGIMFMLHENIIFSRLTWAPRSTFCLFVYYSPCARYAYFYEHNMEKKGICSEFNEAQWWIWLVALLLLTLFAWNNLQISFSYHVKKKKKLSRLSFASIKIAHHVQLVHVIRTPRLSRESKVLENDLQMK